MNIIKSNFIKYTTLIMLIFSCKSNADDDKVKPYLYIDIKGTIEASACTVNNGNPIFVDFKDVMVTRINDEYYKERVDMNIICDSTYPSKLKIKIVGTPSKFDNKLLSTTVPDLAVQFKFNDKKIPINGVGWSELNEINDNFYFDLILIKNKNKELSDGIFNAQATLKVEYQ